MDHHRGHAGALLEAMNAYVYVAPRKLRVTKGPRPSAREDSAVLKVSISSICGTDVRTYRFGNENLLSPRTIGHEACGVICEKDKRVQGFEEGDRVFVVPAIGCGACRSCRRGHTNMCENLRTIGFEFNGTFAQYMEIPPQAFAMGNVVAVPPSLSDAEASLIEPVACCLNGQSFLRLEPEDTVCIFGAGFIGCMHALLASETGCARIIVADVSPARISLFGGLPGDAAGFLNSNAIHYKELSVFGSHASTVEENRHILGLVSRREIDIAKFASKTYALEQIEHAFEALKSESILKVLVAP